MKIPGLFLCLETSFFPFGSSGARVFPATVRVREPRRGYSPMIALSRPLAKASFRALLSCPSTARVDAELQPVFLGLV